MTSSEENYLTEEEKLVNEILFKTAHLLERKYNIQTSGEGAAMPGGIISKLNLAFSTKGPFTKTEIRKILIDGGKLLINQVNNNKSIQPFLKNKPFTTKNVQIIIYNHDKDNREAYDPEISTAELSHGTLIYQTVDPHNTLKYKNEFTETYEEALQALENSSR